MDTAHVGTAFIQFVNNQVAKILRYIVAQKGRRCLKAGNTIGDLDKFERLDPCCEIVLTYCVQ